MKILELYLFLHFTTKVIINELYFFIKLLLMGYPY